MKAVCIYFYFGRNICDFNKIFNRVHQLEFSVCFEPFTYAIYIYGRPCESKFGSCYTFIWLVISLLTSLLLLYIYLYLCSASHIYIYMD